MEQKIIKEIKPFKVFGSGHFIQRQMDVRGWTQTDLAEVLGLSLKTVNQLVQNKQPVTFETAQLLQEAFGISAQAWMNHEITYRTFVEGESEKQKAVKVKSPIYECMPIAEMCKKGWLKKTKDTSELECQVKSFWKQEKLDFAFLQNRDNLKIACKKSDAYKQYDYYALQCWAQQAKLCAESINVPAYNKEALQNLYENLHGYTVSRTGIEDFLRDLRKCGVKFFVLEHLQKTYLDGAAFMDEENPVVVYTGRYKRMDNFWFTLAHEIAHVLLHINEPKCFMDNMVDPDTDQQEEEANHLAQTVLLHDIICHYFSSTLNYLTAAKVVRGAKELNIHPAIILGTLAHDKQIGYAQLHQFNDNPMKYIPEQYNINFGEKLVFEILNMRN